MLRDRGCGIIYISHKMEEILRISDEVTIMRDGQWIATRPAKDLTMNEIIRLMVGRELTNRFPAKDYQVGSDVVLKVEGLTAMYSGLKDVSFELRKGEILGVAGLDGSGRTELLENIFGSATRKSGKLWMNGKPIHNHSPKDSIRNGFAMVTEERRATGIFAIMSVRDNTVISSLKKYLKNHLYLSNKTMQERTNWSINAMHIKTPTQQTQIRSLSGGNQQKVIFGKWLERGPRVFMMDEPTRGIDVGAKYEIYELIINMAKQGKTIIVVSSEMPEILGITNRIGVMYLGRMVELADSYELTMHSLHPYTKSLISAIPIADPKQARASKRIALEGDVPSPLNPPSGCRFRTRCPYADEQCAKEVPEFKEVAPGHYAACHHLDKCN